MGQVDSAWWSGVGSPVLQEALTLPGVASVWRLIVSASRSRIETKARACICPVCRHGSQMQKIGWRIFSKLKFWDSGVSRQLNQQFRIPVEGEGGESTVKILTRRRRR
ncbi:MAG: hypothetical protein M5R42_05430 [Rhodocyclaceae bacterium]|nr:hypothetical protein [Rhodocyclaceae bacterium]